VKFLSVGAELGSVRSVFYEVHCAAFDVFVFVSKRLGAGGQLGMFGCNIVPIIQRSFLPVVRERGDHAAPSEPVSATTFRSTTRERDFRGTTGPAGTPVPEPERQAGCPSRRSTLGISRYARHECGRK
jgi:hypothetical protein